RDAVVGQVRKTDPDFVSRVSIPGVLTNRTVRLFSGQVVPVVQVKSRGIHMWNETALANAAIAEVEKDPGFQRALRLAGRESDEDREREREKLDKNVRAFLDKVYYQFRNLGQTSADRALNYAGTNAFAVASDFAKGMTSGTYVPGNDEHPLYSLDTISVTKSPYCRPDSDCWDVRITFFDPANDRAARVTYLYTYDVSDAYPVSLAPVHQFLGN
ncbi:MAG: hypothetical protein ACJ780_06360, partial [Solirubrobacteraceae bacterium]